MGGPDPEFGEEVAAFVTLRSGAPADEAELLAFCRERLAKFETPKAYPSLARSRARRSGRS